ncbi:MAG: fumarylacetoacetate hydrolase family protein, partial [Actinomycetota bacterium]
MATNVARVRLDGEVRWGVVHGDSIRLLDGHHPTTASFVESSAGAVLAEKAPLGDPVRIADVEVLGPITSNQQFICQAINYRSHMKESGIGPDSSPFNIFFRKASSSMCHAEADIVVPDHVEFCDYEVEIGLVLGRSVTAPITVTDDDLADHVIGLVIVDDVSARDVQLPEGQFYKGKSYRTFGPVGPWLTLVDADDLARFGELELRLWVNDELRQDGSTTDMVHAPAPTLTELSSIQNWGPGDLLATGTPGGCALQVPPKPVATAVQSLSPSRRAAIMRKAAAKNTRRL